jgi:hypothetical protein
VKLVDTTIAVDHLHGVPAAVELARQYRKSHSGIGAVDYLIAATAIVIDADLLTTNVRHFPMFTKLEPPY